MRHVIVSFIRPLFGLSLCAVKEYYSVKYSKKDRPSSRNFYFKNGPLNFYLLKNRMIASRIDWDIELRESRMLPSTPVCSLTAAVLSWMEPLILAV
ncbi:hypothetical protein SAMN05443246_3465 [Paenibacillus sp. GP183]|nr:hypothetical protein SAMN05443246_3465 [Paenibacillus sp. GP183]